MILWYIYIVGIPNKWYKSFCFVKKINGSCLVLVFPLFLIFPSTSGFWDNPQWIFHKHWKCPNWVGSERDSKEFSANQSICSFFGFESSIHNCFWNLLSFSGLSQISKIRNKEYSDHKFWKDFLEFKYIMFEQKFFDKF
jgi:hypothetical protein